VRALDFGKACVGNSGMACRGQPRKQFLVAVNTEGRMRLARRRKRFLDSEVQLQLTALEPQSAAASQRGRLRNLSQAKQISIKTPRAIFLAPRDRDLHMIESKYSLHQPHLRRDLCRLCRR